MGAIQRFKTGEKVIHKRYGLFEVRGTEVQNFGFGDTEYYLLTPVYGDPNSIIRIPVNKCRQLRLPESKEDALKAIDAIPKMEDIWVTDSKKRKAMFTEMIEDGKLIALCTILRCIYIRKNIFIEQKKNLPLTDLSIFQSAEKLCFEEMSYCLNISPREVPIFIKDRLHGEFI